MNNVRTPTYTHRHMQADTNDMVHTRKRTRMHTCMCQNMRTPSHDHMETRTVAHQLVHEYARRHHIVIEKIQTYTNLQPYEYNY